MNKSNILKLILLNLIFSLNFTFIYARLQIEKQFDYPKFTYAKSSTFENRFKNLQSKCEFKTDCSMLDQSDRQNCILKCISKQCYEQIYEFDPLEDGEIDQRFKSFKGCFASSDN